jgi:Protein of unknown function (DUF3828)
MILIALAAAAAQPAETPRAFMGRLYANYRHSDYSPFTHPERVFAPRLLAAIKEDERLAHGEVGFLDGDPLCDCQDTGGMRSSIASVTGSRGTAAAHIMVSWRDTGEHSDIRLKLVRTPAGWRVADVSTANESSLLHDLQESNRKARKH